MHNSDSQQQSAIELYSQKTYLTSVEPHESEPQRYRQPTGIAYHAQVLVAATFAVMMLMSFSAVLVSLGVLADAVSGPEVIYVE